MPAVNAELKALVAAGADWIQIDEPSAAIVPGQAPEYVKMFNACVEGVKAKIGYHVCFGNLLSRPRGKRSVPLDVPGAPRHQVRPVRLRVCQPRDGGDRDVEGNRGGSGGGLRGG